jgi:hypothetical protein
MSLESCLRLTAKILVKWVIFADVTLAICMDLAMLYVTRACNIGWCKLLPLFINGGLPGPFFLPILAFIDI